MTSSKLLVGVMALLTSSQSTYAQSPISFNQTGPFRLKVSTDTNPVINGKYISTCRAGSAIEGLCLGEHTINNSTWNFFWNYTVVNGVPSETGVLTWTLPVVGTNILTVSEAMVLKYNPGTNVVVAMFMPGEGTAVGWDNNSLYVPGQYDDSLFQANLYPNSTATAVDNHKLQLKNWHACWVYWGAYYYNAIAWVSGGQPRNPTCEFVTLEKEEIQQISSIPIIPLPDVPKEPFEQGGEIIQDEPAVDNAGDENHEEGEGRDENEESHNDEHGEEDEGDGDEEGRNDDDEEHDEGALEDNGNDEQDENQD